MAKVLGGRALYGIGLRSVTKSTIDESGHILENLQADVRGGLSSWSCSGRGDVLGRGESKEEAGDEGDESVLCARCDHTNLRRRRPWSTASSSRPDRGDGLAHVARVIARFPSSLCLPSSLLSHCSLDLPFAFIFLCSLLHANLRLYVAQILSLCCLLSRFTKRFSSAQHMRAGRPCGAREVECHGS